MRILFSVSAAFLLGFCGKRAEVSVKTSGSPPELASDDGRSSDARGVTGSPGNPPTQPQASDLIQKEPDSTVIAQAPPAGLTITQEFVSGLVVPGETEYDVDHTVIKAMFTLLRERGILPTSRQFRQIVRTKYTENFVQGHQGEPIEDKFVVTNPIDRRSLERVPDLGTIEVSVDDEPVTNFSVSTDGTELVFAEQLKGGVKVVITYLTGGTPIFDKVRLSHPAVPDSVVVSLNGNTVDPSTYTLSGTQDQISFSDRPIDDAKIIVSYKENAFLPKKFLIDASAVASSIKAMVDGTLVSSTFDSATGEVQVEPAPPEDAMITIKYDLPFIGDPITKFPLVTPWGTVRRLGAMDATTMAPVGISYVGQEIVIDPKDFVDGRKIIVTYLDESRMDGTFSLPSPPLDGLVSVELLLDDNDTRLCPAGAISVSGSSVAITCASSDVVGVKIQYKTEINKTREFTVAGIERPNDATWFVEVNNQATSTYSRTGSTVIFDADLPPAATIKIAVLIPAK